MWQGMPNFVVHVPHCFLPMPPIIERIQALLNLPVFEPAPVRPHDPLGGLMAYKTDTPKYQLDGERLIGLNLAKTGLNDEKWAILLALDGFAPGDLRGLNVSENGLHRLDLSGMTGLARLNASGNKELASLSLPEALSDLEEVDLSACQLRELVLPAGSHKLRRVLLNDNKLEAIDWGDRLPALRQLDLRNNPLKELPDSLGYSEALQSLFLGETAIQNLPKEVIPGGDRANAAESVLAYLQALQTQEKIPLREAKLILVGNGEVGKSSIRIRLQDKKAPLPLPHERTETLDIERLDLKGLPPELTQLEEPIDFQLHIWDFGGQGKHREIQQLFCSRKSLYLFVTACDDLPSKDDYVGFHYWLSMVNAYSYDEDDKKHSPVIHVVNKTDLDPHPVDQRVLRDLFPNLYPEFVAISCETLDKFEDLEQAIQKALPGISPEVFTDGYPQNWMAVKAELEARQSEHYLDMAEYLAICQKQEIEERDARAWLRILDRIGTVIYFGEHPALRDWIVINPIWVKEVMYQVLGSPHIRHGQLNPLYFGDVWPGTTEAEQQRFIALMEGYQLCFSKQNEFGETEYIIPALLDDNLPLPGHLKREPAFRVRFRFDPFIPAGMVSKLIVALQKPQNLFDAPFPVVFGNGPIQTRLMWKSNVILHDPTGPEMSFAHVQEDWENHQVLLNLYGGRAREFFERVRSLLAQIGQDLQDARYLHQLDFEPQGWYRERWRNLDGLEELGVDFFQTPTRDRGRKKKLFFMYSSQDETYRQELDEHLANLRQSGLLETWYDRKILPGQNWDQVIRRELQDSDIILLMLSPAFMNVPYIHEVELEIAQKRSTTAAVVPIFLRACDLKDTWFTLKQGAGKDEGWIASIESRPKRDEAWWRIVQELRRIIEPTHEK